jgi:hypothetical protein
VAALFPKNDRDWLKFGWTGRPVRGKIFLGVGDITHPEAAAMHDFQIALQTYWQVAELVQRGHQDRARALALTIGVDHLRGLALLLANDSRRL